MDLASEGERNCRDGLESWFLSQVLCLLHLNNSFTVRSLRRGRRWLGVGQSEDPSVSGLEELARLEVSVDGEQSAVLVLDEGGLVEVVDRGQELGGGEGGGEGQEEEGGEGEELQCKTVETWTTTKTDLHGACSRVV